MTSGIRIGTPAVTTRGFKAQEMKEIADIIADVLNAPENEEVLAQAKQKVTALTDRFPLYDN